MRNMKEIEKQENKKGTEEITPQMLRQEFVFEDARPFASCHASTLAVTQGGEVLAAWFGGTAEGDDDVAIWCSHRTEQGWTAPVKVADEEGIPHWNPVLYRDPSGTLHLYYKKGHKIPTWQTYVIESTDDGRSWSEPRELVPSDQGGRGPVKNKPIQLRSGVLAAPASIENEVWDAFVDLSLDGGSTWEHSELVPIEHRIVDAYAEGVPPIPEGAFKGRGVIQPTLWESAPDQVHMLLRSSSGFIYQSDSADGGRTWCPAYSNGLPNNNSGIDLAQLDDGRLVLIYNPVGENWGARHPIVIEVSEDQGRSWGNRLVLEDIPGEYSYPSIVAVGNQVHLTYTWKRERIVYWNIQY